jgi:hypothetical protein
MRGCEAAEERGSSHATRSSCGTFPGVSGQHGIRSRSYAEHRSLRETFPWPRPALLLNVSWGLHVRSFSSHPARQQMYNQVEQLASMACLLSCTRTSCLRKRAGADWAQRPGLSWTPSQ